MPFVHCCFFAEFFTPIFSGFFCCLPRGFRWPFWRAWQGWVTAVGGPSIQPLFPGAFDAVVDSAIAPSLTDDDFTASLPDLFPVDNGSHLPSLRDQSSWTPLPVASLRAVDAPGPSSADVYPSDSSLADALAADDVRSPAIRFAHITRRPDQMCQLRELIDGGVVRPPCFLSTLLVLFFSCFCLTMFSSVFQFPLLLPLLPKEQLAIVVIVWLCKSIRLFYGPIDFRAVLMEASCGGQLRIVVARVVVRILTYAGKLLFFRQVLLLIFSCLFLQAW
ncbi:uncharacterized protein LOC124702809 isoform X2 [Lolium rigidum]|uniref:uncharacterized protein LOC124702805 isoform X2 n=1 Tax=Lolium rigidum TaxID=89674 RepID=UPI001F5D8F94|nr:uncharacterized protein LOC124702805 isoform X2 [Lolium rigidum]XP_047090937.1 uncharacterized protein LOC124702809 isoform X2 [Lolium rigidum]